MELGFLKVKASFRSSYTISESIYQLKQIAENEQYPIKIIKENGNTLTLLTSTGSMLYYNSFMPIAEINLQNSGNKTNVLISFSLRKSVKIGGLLLSALALLVECNLFVLLAKRELISDGIIFFPFGLWLFGFLMYSIGLYMSSRRVFKLLRSVLIES